MSAGANASKLKRTLLSPERSEVGQTASAKCRIHGCAARASQPGLRKPGGQAEAAFIIPEAKRMGLERRRLPQRSETEQRSGTIRISLVPHTSVCGQHPAVVSEAMLRFSSLLHTDHMLGEAQSSTFITQINLAIKEVTQEMALDEG